MDTGGGGEAFRDSPQWNESWLFLRRKQRRPLPDKSEYQMKSPSRGFARQAILPDGHLQWPFAAAGRPAGILLEYK